MSMPCEGSASNTSRNENRNRQEDGRATNTSSAQSWLAPSLEEHVTPRNWQYGGWDDGRPGVNFSTQYDRATNCGNTTNSHNVLTATTTTTIGNLIMEDRHLMDNFVKTECSLDAAFNARLADHRSMCLNGTRTELLADIMNWSETHDGACIFWLNGMAGTGKTTIARTLAQIWHDRKILGASFFFARGQDDLSHASKFFPSLAYQLAYSQPRYDNAIHRAIRENPAISNRSLREQWKHLILEPLSQQIGSQSQMMFVIDALDECNGENDIGLILRLLSQAKNLRSVRLRVLVTSRPETAIRLGFSDISNDSHRDYTLHEISRSLVDRDIWILLQHEFGITRKRHSLPCEWPHQRDLQQLVRKADGLFIYATTACLFICHRDSNPPDRLILVLKGAEEHGPLEQLDSMYTTLLQYAICHGRSIPGAEIMVQRFQKVVGSIITLFNPLNARGLADLLNTPLWEVKNVLRSLTSVLHYSEADDIKITPLHLSFRDYLLDSQRCDPRFNITEAGKHQDLAASCLQLLSERLRVNICSLELPGTVLSEIDGEVIRKCLPPSVQYACLYWVEHLRQSSDHQSQYDRVYTFLREHCVHWFEALSLMGRMGEGIRILTTFESILTPQTNNQLRALARDAVRFITYFRSTIETAPLQVYYAGLLFSPTGCTIRELLMSYSPAAWMRILPTRTEKWHAGLQVLKGHQSGINYVAFSPDGKVLASASDDETVRPWDPTTGICTATLEGHFDSVVKVAFLPNGKVLASASIDRTVRLWDPTTGICTATLEGHSDSVLKVAFSPDGKVLASASGDRTVRLWHPTTGICTATLKGHSDWVRKVAFSPDGKVLASASEDKTVRLWDPTTGICTATLEGHSDWVREIAFSPDGKVLASASVGKAVRLWDPTTGICTATLKGHSALVVKVAFSPDGKVLASASCDRTVCLWDPTTGICTATLKGHSKSVLKVAFSPDGKVLASASGDGTVRLWDPTTGICTATPEGHSGSVSMVAFSADGKVLASASDKTVRLWDPTTGICTATLKGHSDSVRKVAFSPDGKVLASASGDRTVRLWDPTTGICTATLEGHSDWVLEIAFSPDGKVLASTSVGNAVRLWDPTTGICTATLKGHSALVVKVAFSPDGKVLASASCDRTVRLWDLTTGFCTATLEGHFDSVPKAASSPDGKVVASASRDRTVRLWDPTTGCTATHRGYFDWVPEIAFSPDSKVLALASRGKPVRLWDPATGICSATPEGHSGGVTSLVLPLDATFPQVESVAGAIKISCFDGEDFRLATNHAESSLSGFCLSHTGNWILLGNYKILLFPSGEDVSSWAFRGRVIALGHSSGRVTFVECRDAVLKTCKLDDVGFRWG